MSPSRFRAMALALPDVVEGAHQGHPDFRVAGRVFATLLPDGAQAMVRVPPAVQRRLCELAAATPANGAWGRAGCTMLALVDVDDAFVRGALHDAWTAAVAAKRSSARRRRGGAAANSPRPGR